MDYNNLLKNILINTYNPNITLRLQAEKDLNDFLNTSGSLYTLLTFISTLSSSSSSSSSSYNNHNNNDERELRLAASISLKNKSREYFRRDDNNNSIISNEEKETSKELILNILLNENDNIIRGMLAETIRNISEFEYPERWPQLMPILFTNLQGEILQMYNSLTALRKIVKRYEFKHKEERAPLHEIIQHLFPLLQELITHILDNNSLEAAHVLRLCFKIFWSCTQYALPPVTGVNVNLWFHALATILNKRLPEASEGLEPVGQPLSEEERNEWPWWKLKKWAARIVTHFIQRYGNPRYSGDENKAFSEHFRTHTAKLLLEPMVNLLIQKSEGAFLTTNVHRMCITYLCNSVEMSPTYKILKPHLEFILFGVIFPTLSLSQADINLFTEDPTEYIRKVHNVLEDWLDPRIAAINLLQMLSRYRLKDTLPLFLPHLQRVMDDYRAAPEHLKNHSAKEACLVALAAIANVLKEKKPYCNQIEGIFNTHVIPELSSSIGILRARACWMVEHFSDVEWKKPRTCQLIIEGLLRGLRDPDLPVQAAAACSMRLFIDSDIARDIVRPILYDVVNEYFRIMSDIESDVVIGALQAIVLQFGEEIEGIAGLIIEQLLRTFEAYSSAGEDDDEAAFGATECLETVTTVLEVVKENPAVIAAVEGMLTPLLFKIFSNDEMIEYIENGIEMISYLTYYPQNINPRLWEVFGPMISALDNWAYDYMMEMLTPIMHLISKDTSTFLQGTYQEVPLTAMVVRTCLKVLDQEKIDDEREAKASATLLTCVLICCKGHIDEYIPSILMTTLNKLAVVTKTGITNRLLGIVMSIILYNPESAFQVFRGDPGAEQLVFQKLFERIPSIHSHSLRRLVIASFSALLSIPKEYFTPFFAMNLQPIMSMLVRVVSTIDDEEDEDGEDDEDGDEEEGEGDDEADGDDEGDESYAPRNGAKVSKSTLKKLAAMDVPEEGYSEDEDCINVADEEYLQTMEELKKHGGKRYNAYGDEIGNSDADEDDLDEIDEPDTPLDAVDMVLLFCDTMNQSFSVDPQLFTQLQNGLDSEDQERLKTILETAEYRRNHPDGEDDEGDGEEEDDDDET